MSKDSFKVKKGLTLTPIDPADITNPQAGDLIADSTDDNKIKKYDATSSDWTSVGGSAGIGGNLMSEFEKLTPTETNVTSVVDTVTFLPIDDNNKSIKATWAGSVGSIQYQVPLDASLQETQGTVTVWLRTSLSDMQISSVQDGVKISTLNVTGNNKWRQYEIPMVLGGSNIGFIVESLTAQTGDVFIDQPFVGLAPTSFSYDVAQVERFGKASWTPTANCAWVNTTASFSSFPVDNDCPDPTIVGKLKAPATKLPAIVLPAGSPAGTYAFRTTGGFISINQDTCSYQLSDGTQTAFLGMTGNSGIADLHNAYNPVMLASLDYDSALTADTTVEIQAYSTGTQCQINSDNDWRQLNIEVIYYPPQSTIVTQVQTLDVSTANEFSAKVSAAGVVSDQNLDWLNDCSIAATSQFTCNFKSDIFTVAPNCVVSVVGSNRTGNILSQTNSTRVAVETGIADTSGFSAIAAPFELHCSKQGADFNKSAMIVGNFEQIKTTELCRVYAENNSGQTPTANTQGVHFENEVTDNCGLWNVTEFTPNYSGLTTFEGTVWSNTITRALDLYEIDGGVPTHVKRCGQSADAPNGHEFNCSYEVVAGRSYQIRQTSSQALISSDFHYINIQQQPDFNGIIKNLNDNKTVKCQRKALSTNVASTGIISDLTFNNLTVGKKYSIYANFAVVESNVSNNQKTFTASIRYGSGAVIRDIYTGADQNILYRTHLHWERPILTATESSIQVNITDATNMQMGGGASATQSTLEICELPDYYIETDEW